MLTFIINPYHGDGIETINTNLGRRDWILAEQDVINIICLLL